MLITICFLEEENRITIANSIASPSHGSSRTTVIMYCLVNTEQLNSRFGSNSKCGKQ